MSSVGEECVIGRLGTGKQKSHGVLQGSPFSVEMFGLYNVTYFGIKDLLM